LNQPLRIEYHSPHTDTRTQRDIMPLRLLAYMGTWHLIAHCTLRHELRDFALARIRNFTPTPAPISVPAYPDCLAEYLREHFGILRDSTLSEVVIRFTPAISPWIREQVWHPNQKLTIEADGAITLSFPASDLREVKRKIMRYGAQAEVIAPRELRDEIAAEVKKFKQFIW
jgi:predicted DNA-binding transcriptional regulator YafY